jgi:hypothetical protein
MTAAVDDFSKYAKTLDEPYKSVYTYYAENTEFAERNNMGAAFGYSPKLDAVVFDPAKPSFARYDFNDVILHELTHRYDELFVRSWENKDFVSAVNTAKDSVMSSLKKWQRVIDREGDNIKSELFDVLSGLSANKLKTGAGHATEYWTASDKNLYAEIFAELAVMGADKRGFGAFDDLLRGVQTAFDKMF